MKKAMRMVFATFIAILSMANVMAANVAKIGDVEYATIDAAVAAWKPGEMIELLADIERDSYFVFSQNTYALDGKGHTIKCTKAHSKSWKYFVNANAGTQTFKNIIIDGNGKVPFVMQAIDGGKLILENVTIKGAKTTTTGSLFSRSTSLGYGIHVNDGSVEAKNITITNCEVADVYQDGASSSFTLSGDNCNVNFIGSSSAKESVTSTAKGYYAYEVTYKSNLGNGTAKTISNKSLNGIIDQVQKSITTIVASFPVSVEIKSATVKLLQDVVLAETFTSNDTKLTINGNGKTITGTFKFSSTPSPISNIVLGNGSILDCTASMTTGFSGVSVAANTAIDILLPASTDMNSYALPVSLATDAVANIFVGDKKYIAKNGVISSAEKLAQIGDKQYATLQEAIDAANGAVIQVLKDVALASPVTVPAGKTLTLNLAGRKVTVSGADYALVNNGNLKIVDMGLVTVVAAEATIGDETAAPILIMAPFANDGVAVIDDATGGSIAGVQNNGTFALESGAVVAASASVPAIDNTADAVAVITGGTVEGKLQSVDKTALTITGGSFTGESNVSEFVGGDYGVDSDGVIVKNVAKIGEAGYLTLEDAVAAAQTGDTVTLFSDVELNETLTVAAGKSVTLDLAGFTIESSTTAFDVSGALTLYGGTLIVTDSSKDMFTVAAEGSVTLKHGQFSSDVTGFCADGVICVKQPSGLWAILPDATVETLNPMVLKAGEYSVLEDMKWPPKDPTGDSYLGVVMRFTANDTEETIAESPFKDYATDFYITISGMEGDSFIADENTFLVGNYGDFGWIKIPLKGMKIEDGVRYPVLGSVFGDSYFTYEFICTSVREMLCAMTISPEIIAANPNLKVVLDLAVEEDPESGDEPLNVGGYDYSAEAFMPAAARIGEVYYRTLADAFAGAQAGDTVELLADVNVGTLLNLPAEKALTLDLNGKTVSSSAALNNAGELTVRDSSAEKTGKFNMAIVNSGKLAISSGYFGGTISGEGEFAIAGGTFVQDVADYCVAGCQSVKQPGNSLWKVGKLPNAEVVNMGPTEISDYRIWGGGSNLNQGTDTIKLQVALDFIAKDSDKEARENAYGRYVTDFYITIDGAEGGSFVADGCYLAGSYGSLGWIMIPLDGMSITNGVVHPVITSAFAGGFNFSYEDICTLVKDFKCGIYFSEAVLDANPGLTVSLDLGLSESLEQAQNATFTPVIENPFVFDVEDMTSAVAVVGSEYFTSFADAVTAAIASGEEVKVVADAVVSGEIAVNKNQLVNLNGKTLTMAAGASIKVENAAVKLVGGTFADLSASNIALSGNATLTLPAKVDGDFGPHFTSENVDGSFSIATLFQSYIQVVDGEPCVGFLMDTPRSDKYKLMGRTALDDGSGWEEVSVEAAAEAVANPLVPLYWAKPAGGYRFFKVVIEK